MQERELVFRMARHTSSIVGHPDRTRLVTDRSDLIGKPFRTRSYRIGV